VVLFEMLTGKQLFEGELVSDTLAAVLRQEPDWSQAPAEVRRLLQKCLEKDPNKRLRDIGDVQLLLEAPEPIAPRSKSGGLAWLVAALGFLAAMALAFVHFRETMQEPPVLQLSLSPPENSTIHSFSVSPDGRSVAMAVTTAGKRSLWIRPLDALQARSLPGTEDAASPFWSPDGRFIAFSSQGKLKKIAVSGGPAQTIVEHSAVGAWPGSWNLDNTILVGSSLRRVSASGGEAIAEKLGPFIAMYPAFLDSKRFLYSAMIDPKQPGIYIGSLDSGDTRRLLPDPSNTAYAPPRAGSRNGHILFVREGTLMAQPIDVDTHQLSGEAFPVAEQVNAGYQVGYGQFSVSQNGTLVYQVGQSAAGRQLAWFDRAGKQQGFIGEAGRIWDFSLSPDEKSVAIARIDTQLRTSDLWIRDLERGTEARFTSHPSLHARPVWSTDGAQIIFSSTRTGRTDLYKKPSNGNAPEESVLSTFTPKYATDWSRDGKILLFQTQYDVFALRNGDQKPVALLQSEYREAQPQLSPDRRWLAYVSDESGRNEIYVQPFSPDGNPSAGKRPISTNGGTDPRWRRDGKELFFLAADGKLMSAAVKLLASADLKTEAPHPLFEIPPISSRVATGSFRYAVSNDGQRFLVLLGPNEPPQPLTVITNWQSAVKR
jgi:Tol biopolymer transport system component